MRIALCDVLTSGLKAIFQGSTACMGFAQHAGRRALLHSDRCLATWEVTYLQVLREQVLKGLWPSCRLQKQHWMALRRLCRTVRGGSEMRRASGATLPPTSKAVRPRKNWPLHC